MENNKFNLSERIMIDQWDKEEFTTKIFVSDVKEFIKKLKEELVKVTNNGKGVKRKMVRIPNRF